MTTTQTNETNNATAGHGLMPDGFTPPRWGVLPADNAGRDDETHANARLIAAAPELLAALEMIHANAAESVEWIRRVTSAAIAKAK